MRLGIDASLAPAAIAHSGQKEQKLCTEIARFESVYRQCQHTTGMKQQASRTVGQGPTKYNIALPLLAYFGKPARARRTHFYDQGSKHRRQA